MAISGSFKVEVHVPGVSQTVLFDRTSTGSIPALDVELAAAKAGSLSTRGGDREGVLTLTAGHGIEAGDILAIFWADGSAYLAVAGTPTATEVPFSSALGTVLPAEDTAITVDVMENHNVDFDGDLLELFVATFTKRGLVVFEDSVGTSASAVQYADDIPEREGMLFIAAAGMTNELAGNAVDEVWIANGDSSDVNAFRMGGLYNTDE